MSRSIFSRLSLLVLTLCLLGLGSFGVQVLASSDVPTATAVVYSLEIEYVGTGGGVVELSYEEAAPGTTIELSAVPDKFSLFSEWQVLQGDVTLATYTEAQTSFVMPEDNVLLSAVFELILYDITVYTEYSDGGPRDERVGEAAYTAIVTANLETLPGFVFKGWELAKGHTVLNGEQDLELSFVMPDESVEIIAYFEPILFSDIEGHALFEFLHQASYESWLDSYIEEELRPNEEISRGEFAHLLVRAFELVAPEDAAPCAFTDIAEHPYGQEIETLALLGLVSGTSQQTFSPEMQLTREQAVAILVRVCAFVHIPEVEPLQNPEVTYSDTEQISPWAVEVVARATKLGIEGGREDGSFAPQEAENRAEAIAQIVRALGLGRTRRQ